MNSFSYRRLILLLILCACCGAENARAQKDYKGERAPNPTVNRFVYNDGGNYDQAIETLTEALRLNASSAEAHHSLGTSYFLKERFTEAISQYSEAVRLKPDYTYAYYDLGMAYVRAGNKQAALEQYEILKRMNPGLAANLRSYIR